jgi:hypothetical protein
MKVMLDLFAGRLGWSKAFLERGWRVIAVDLIRPSDIPDGVDFIQTDVLNVTSELVRNCAFACASSPCEQFSVHGMKNFHPNPPYPELGVRLFNHTRAICEGSGRPYIIENVRTAQQFVGTAVHHCGPFYLWGNGVPMLMPQGISKGIKIGGGAEVGRIRRALGKEGLRKYRLNYPVLQVSGKSPARKAYTAGFATIPPELASCVADYAERLLSSAA